MSSLAERSRSSGRRIVLLHVGEPKTGTTFLQHAMWDNRGLLRDRDVHLPGFHPQDHYRASRDARDVQQDGSSPRGSWQGEWDILAAQAARGTGVAVISDEALGTATAEQIDRIVASLAPADVHVALTVRSLGTLLPAKWQELIKNGGALDWESWVSVVLDRRSASPSAVRRRFWRSHDTRRLVQRWVAAVSAANVHVVTVPPPGAPRTLLWHRWCALLGVDDADTVAAAVADPTRDNRSLGYDQTEFLRSVNQALPSDLPRWFYEGYVKSRFAERILGPLDRGGTITLPDTAQRWVARYEANLVKALPGLEVSVWGDVAELRSRPQPVGGSSAGSADPARLADLGVHAVVGLIEERLDHPIAEVVEPRANDLAAFRLITRAVPSTRMKRAVRELTARHRVFANARVTVWRLANLASRRSRRHAGNLSGRDD